MLKLAVHHCCMGGDNVEVETMSTIQDDARKLGRPFLARPTWELRNIVRALHTMPWLNTEDDKARLAEAKRELKLRGDK